MEESQAYEELRVPHPGVPTNRSLFVGWTLAAFLFLPLGWEDLTETRRSSSSDQIPSHTHQ